MAAYVKSLTIGVNGIYSINTGKDSSVMANVHTNSHIYCSECGATSWKSCICLRSADPESEEELKDSLNMVQNSRVVVGEGLAVAEQDCKTSGQNMTSMYQDNKEPRVFTNHPDQDVTEGTDNFGKMLEEVSKLQANLDNLRTDKTAMKQSLAESCLTFLHDLKAFKKKLNDHIDKMEKKAKLELNQLYETYDKAIASDLSMCDTTSEKLQHLVDQLQACQQSSQIYTHQDMEKQLTEAQQAVKTLCLSDNTYKLDFVFHPVFQSFTTNIENLGQFMTPKSDASKEQPFTKAIDVNIRHSSDLKTCCISGICQLKNGHVLLADKNNQNIKYLDTRYKVMGCHQLSAIPKSVCCYGNNEAAIALSNNTIEFVSLDDKLMLIRTLELEHPCCGLASSGDKLFVSDMGKRVYVYNGAGTLINTIYKDHLGQKVFTNNRHIAISEDSHHVYVADRAMGLVKLDQNGRILSIFTHPDLKTAHGVCLDQSGRVYISDSLSHNILCYIDKRTKQDTNSVEPCRKKHRNGKAEDTEAVVVSADKVTYPGAICLDNVKSNLLVTSYPPFGGCDILKVFSLS